MQFSVVLLAVWKSVGMLVAAINTASFLALVDKFSEAASEYVEVRYTFTLYAQQYLLYMNSLIMTDELAMNLLGWVWNHEAFGETAAIQRSEAAPLMWADKFPSHMEKQVCMAAVIIFFILSCLKTMIL